MSFTQKIAAQNDIFQTSMERMNKPRKYLNYGYSIHKGESLEKKQRQLCLEIFKAADIQSNDVIIDVGFGSGEQDFLLARTYPFRKLIGLNISPKQVSYATKRARHEKLDDKLTFQESGAENMESLGNQFADKMLAIECAPLFDRPFFYAEAARVLKKGALLILADISFRDKLEFITQKNEALQRVGASSKNRQNWEKHFNTLSIRNINRQTLLGTQMAVLQILTSLNKGSSWGEIISWLALARDSQIVVIGILSKLLSYDLIVLQKK